MTIELEELFKETKETESEVGLEDTKKEEETEVKTAEDIPPVETASTEEEEQGDGKTVPLKAMLSERTKRQEAERELAAIKAGVQKDVAEEDYDGESSPELQMQFRINNLSRDIMMDTYEDYAEKEELFTELAKKDTSLIDKMIISPNPAKFAYMTARDHLQTQEMLKIANSDEFKKFKEWQKTQASGEKVVEKQQSSKRININDVASSSNGTIEKVSFDSFLDDVFRK